MMEAEMLWATVRWIIVGFFITLLGLFLVATALGLSDELRRRRTPPKTVILGHPRPLSPTHTPQPDIIRVDDHTLYVYCKCPDCWADREHTTFNT